MEIEAAPSNEGAPEGEPTGTPEGEGAPDISALLGEFGSKLDQFGTQFGERLDRLEQPAGGEPEGGSGGGEPEIYVPQFNDDDFTAEGDLTAEAQARAVQEIAQRAVTEAMAPRMAAEREERRVAYADALETKYPELGEQETQNAVFDRAKQAAQQFARITGKPELAELAGEPEFLEVVYLGMKAEKQSGDEVPAGSEKEVTLEGGGGAGAASASGGDDAGDRIVQRANKSRFRLGTG